MYPQQSRGVNERLTQWLRMEHYRLHCVEQWPEGPHKQTALAGIHSALQSLQLECHLPIEPAVCMVCASRRTGLAVMEFPTASQGSAVIMPLAA